MCRDLGKSVSQVKIVCLSNYPRLGVGIELAFALPSLLWFLGSFHFYDSINFDFCLWSYFF